MASLAEALEMVAVCLPVGQAAINHSYGFNLATHTEDCLPLPQEEEPLSANYLFPLRGSRASPEDIEGYFRDSSPNKDGYGTLIMCRNLTPDLKK